MNQLLEWSPLLVFFLMFKAQGIYSATAALMVTCVAVLLAHRYRTGRFKPMHIITMVTVMVLGSATLLLHDKRFIQWKPTVVLGLMAAAFLGSVVIGEKPLARRMFEAVFNAPLELPRSTWTLVNALWVVWLALLAIVNVYVARNFDESVWVNFKVFGIMVAMMLFMIPQVVWLNGKARPAEDAAPP